MLDTIKLGIPLTPRQHERLLCLAQQAPDRWQFAKVNLYTGELFIRRVTGLAEADQPSYHREIMWDVPPYCDDPHLVVEFSLPKFWYGHNIHLLYDYLGALRHFRKLLQKQLRSRFVDVLDWKVLRLDVCYAWRCPSQKLARQILQSLKYLHFPGKEPHIYRESLMFAGRTYSFKFYLKLPEFIHHDRRALLKQNANLEWVDYLEKLADGVIRCEATLRGQFLRAGKGYLDGRRILLVRDVVDPIVQVEFDDRLLGNHPEVLTDSEIRYQVMAAVSAINSINLEENDFDNVLCDYYLNEPRDGQTLEADASHVMVGGLVNFNFKGGRVTWNHASVLVVVLSYLMDKFLGENRTMDTASKVRAKLLESYSQNKAIVLLGFWLQVQRFGTEDAKSMYPDRTYYRHKSDLKKAGISLVEPPKSNGNLAFLNDFRFEVPSPHSVNRVDDYRDSASVLNLPTGSWYIEPKEG